MSEFDYLMSITGSWATWACDTLDDSHFYKIADRLEDFGEGMRKLVYELHEAEDGTARDRFYARARIGFLVLDNLPLVEEAHKAMTELGTLMILKGEIISPVDLFIRLAKSTA